MGTSNILTLTTGDVVFSNDDSGPNTINSIIAGSNGLTVSGLLYQLTLTGANTFTGNINLDYCGLSVSSDANLGASTGSTINLENNYFNATQSFTTNHAFVMSEGSSFTIAAAILVASTKTLTVNGQISDVNSLGLYVGGGGTLRLGNATDSFNGLNFEADNTQVQFSSDGDSAPRARLSHFRITMVWNCCRTTPSATAGRSTRICLLPIPTVRTSSSPSTPVPPLH